MSEEYIFSDEVKLEINEKTKLIFNDLSVEIPENFLNEFEEFHKLTRSDIKIFKNFLKKQSTDIPLLKYINKFTSDHIWQYLYIMFLLYENCYNEKDDEILKALANKIDLPDKESKNDTEKLMDMFKNVEKPKDTKLISNIINDIKSNLNTNGEDIDSLIENTKEMGKKYQEMINNGEMSLDDMMKSMMGIISNPSDIIENMNDIDISKLPDPQKLMSKLSADFGVDSNMMDQVKSMMGNGDLLNSLMPTGDFDPSKMMDNILSKQKIDDIPLTEEQLKEMEEFYSKLSI